MMFTVAFMYSINLPIMAQVESCNSHKDDVPAPQVENVSSPEGACIDSRIIKKEDLRPTSDEIVKELSPDADYEFLQQFHRIYHDLTQLEALAYSDNPSMTLLQTMVCLFRISELHESGSVDLEITIPIIVYLQDKEQYALSHLHSLYALQNTDFSDRELLEDANDGYVKIRMLYECHAENLYHLSHYEAVTECTKEFMFKFDHIPTLTTSYRVYHLSFFANIQQKRYKEAFNNITNAIRISPDSATLYNHRCFVLCELGKFERALKDANKCLEIDPNHQIGLNNRGSVYNDLNEYEKALIDLDRAIEIADDLNGSSANAHRHRAFAHYMLQNYGKAIDDVNIALSMNNDYREAEDLKVQIWSEICESARQGINQYFAGKQLIFMDALVYVITDFVVGGKTEKLSVSKFKNVTIN